MNYASDVIRMTIVLISCVKKKLTYRARAQDLYISPLFRFNLEYARSLKPEAIYILSAKYGLVGLDQEIDTYNLTLNTMSEIQKKAWAQKVLMDLRQKTDLVHDHFVFLAGMNYRKHLIPSMRSYEIPLEGYSFGEQLRELKRRINKESMSEICQRLHQLFNNLKVHSFPFNPREIPINGIYVLFEKGELAHGTNRIVRIGTHTGKDRLRSRLHQHFIHENKDLSIFRKNIGRALLNREHDPFLDPWELDLTTHDAKLKYAGKIDLAKQKQVERSVTEGAAGWLVKPNTRTSKKRPDSDDRIIAERQKWNSYQ